MEDVGKEGKVRLNFSDEKNKEIELQHVVTSLM